MNTCPRCHLEFRSAIYREIIRPFGNPRQADGSWREQLMCGHSWVRPAGVTVYFGYRRACHECLAAHHKELGVA